MYWLRPGSLELGQGLKLSCATIWPWLGYQGEDHDKEERLGHGGVWISESTVGTGNPGNLFSVLLRNNLYMVGFF